MCDRCGEHPGRAVIDEAYPSLCEGCKGELEDQIQYNIEWEVQP